MIIIKFIKALISKFYKFQQAYGGQVIRRVMKLPQAIILAAGEASRMFPYLWPHKSMIEVGGKPILWHTLKEIKKSGGHDVVIVINQNNINIPDYFKNGKSMGLSIKYAIQKEPRGMGNALLSAKNYIQDKFFIINPNHINLSEFLPVLSKNLTPKYGGILLGSKTKEPWKYGIFKLEGSRILEIIEKPSRGKEPSDVRVVGLYLLNKNFLRTLANTPLSDFQLEAAIGQFFEKNNVRLLKTAKKVFSLKYPWDIFQIKEFLGVKSKSFISRKSSVSSRAIIQGKVTIEEGAKIFEGAVLKGPVYVGKNVVIGSHALVRENTFLEEGARVGAMSEIKNSFFMKNSHFHSGFMGDSIVGENTRIGAGFVTANRRFDRKEIFVNIKKEKISTRCTFLGAIIGHNVSIGIKSGTMPGVAIGSGSVVFPGTIVYQNVPENTIIKKDEIHDKPKH